MSLDTNASYTQTCFILSEKTGKPSTKTWDTQGWLNDFVLSATLISVLSLHICCPCFQHGCLLAPFMRYKWGAIPHEYLWWKCTIVVPWDLIPLCWPLFSIFKLVATELPELLIILPCTDSRKSWICTCQAASDELGMLIIQKLGMSFGKRTVKTTTVFFNYWSIYLCICVNSFWNCTLKVMKSPPPAKHGPSGQHLTWHTQSAGYLKT